MKLDKRLLRQIKAVRIFLVVTVALGLLLSVLIVMQAHYLSTIISAIFLDRQGLAQIQGLLVALLVVIVARSVLLWGSDVAANRVAMRVKTQLRERLFAHLLALGPTYTKGERSGELTNTLVEGVEALDAYFSQYLPQMFLVVLMPLVIVIVVFSIDPLSGVVLLVTAPVLPIFMILIGMQAEALTKKQWKLMSLMSAHFLDVLQGITTLKLFGRSAAQQETIRSVSERFRHTTMRVLRVAFLSSLVMEMGATLSTAIIAVEIGLRLLYGQIAFQPAFFVLLLAPEFYLPLRTLGTRYHAGMTGAAAAQRIFEILEIPLPSGRGDRGARKVSPLPPYLFARESVEGVGATPCVRPGPPFRTGEGIRFEDVSFTYDGQRPALKNVSFHIEPGQQVALVGASGAGKSTLAHLLLRFMEPESGTISINGISCKEMPARKWREQIAWVPQRPYLFNATVAENIRLAAPNATDEEVVQAAQQADAHAFITQLPQGYGTIIGERGTRLSGGQVQRLSLARAFLKNAPVLLLDEATSNLDSEQEAQVLAAIQRLMQGRMVLIIAHHLSAIYSADQVIMLADGQVIEAGFITPP